jgi:hypothetical protein
MFGAGVRGYLRFVPTAGWATPEVPESYPPEQLAKLIDGAVSVELEPTGPGWAWGVEYRLLGLEHWTEYYVVPDTGTINLASLVEVDVSSLEPTTEEPDPAWYSYVESVGAGTVGRVQVVTGSEVRPSFPSVFWIGGATQPINMAENTDVWFKAT